MGNNLLEIINLQMHHCALEEKIIYSHSYFLTVINTNARQKFPETP